MSVMKRTTIAALMLMLPAGLAASPAAHPGPDTTRAKELRAKAESLFDTPSRWVHAADLLRESASLLERTSPQRYHTLVISARVYSQAGKLHNSRKAFQEAADNALARGALVDAAQAFVEAAHVAARQGNARLAVELTGRARLLAESPHLNAGDRSAILGFARVA